MSISFTRSLLLSGLLLFSIIVTAQPGTKFLGIWFEEKGSAFTVTFKLVGTPAAEAPLYVGDTLLAVNKVSTAGKTSDDVFKMLYGLKEDSVWLTVKGNGRSASFSVNLVSQAQLKLRVAAALRNVVLKDLAVPRYIPSYTNWGYMFNKNGQPLYADDIEFLPGGVIKRTTKRNRQSPFSKETWEETTVQLLMPDLSVLPYASGLKDVQYFGRSGNIHYYTGHFVDPKVGGVENVRVWNNLGQQVFMFSSGTDEVYNGSRITELEYMGENVFALRQRNKPFKWGLFDQFAKPLTDFDYDEFKKWDGPGAIAKKGKKWKLLTFPQLAAENGPWIFNDENGKFVGYFNKNGKQVNKPNLISGYAFREGLAAARAENGKHGFINEKGEWAIPPTLGWANSFSGGLAPVKVDGGDWIYINTNGVQAVPGGFKNAREFQENGRYAYVEMKDGEPAIIDNTGNVMLLFAGPVEQLYVAYEAPGLLRIQSKGLTYFKDLYDVAYLKFDRKKGRLKNPDDISLENERVNLANQRQREWEEYKAEENKRSYDRQTSEVTAMQKSAGNTSHVCEKCNGTGYFIYMAGSTISGTTYFDKPTEYVDKWGLKTRNYYTLKCSTCKGKGVVSNN